MKEGEKMKWFLFNYTLPFPYFIPPLRSRLIKSHPAFEENKTNELKPKKKKKTMDSAQKF